MEGMLLLAADDADEDDTTSGRSSSSFSCFTPTVGATKNNDDDAEDNDARYAVLSVFMVDKEAGEVSFSISDGVMCCVVLFVMLL